MGRDTIDREARSAILLQAAEHVFMRFGYNRTTMGLLAEAAGISRPAVYLLFPGKEEIFSALILALNKRQIDQLGARVAQLESLHEQLLTSCVAWNESVYDIHAAHPESRDMDDLSFAAVRTLYEQLADFFTQIMAAAGKPAAAAQIGGRTLALAARGCRVAATSREDMVSMIECLVAAVAR